MDLQCRRNTIKYVLKIIKKIRAAAKEKKLVAAFVFIHEQFAEYVKKIS